VDALTEFASLRPLLFSVAYRMLGSASEADDVLQDTYLRWHDVDRAAVVSPKAYLTAIVTRLCVDRLEAARARRTDYVGVWLPEPLSRDPGPPPGHALDLAESLSLAFLLMLERLTPAERAVYLLRLAFDVEYAELAGMLETSEANCRQLFSRAQKKLAGSKRFDASPERRSALLDGFVAACESGDVAGLRGLLAEDVQLLADGGGRDMAFGRARAPRAPLVGRGVVARFLLAVYGQRPSGVALRPRCINGGPGLAVLVDGALTAALTLDAGAAGIEVIYIVGNPAKLARLVG
jgi:RNA polymerase sigma-70 factor, ECF subfamily